MNRFGIIANYENDGFPHQGLFRGTAGRELYIFYLRHQPAAGAKFIVTCKDKRNNS
jgi:hypothetical protein